MSPELLYLAGQILAAVLLLAGSYLVLRNAKDADQRTEAAEGVTSDGRRR